MSAEFLSEINHTSISIRPPNERWIRRRRSRSTTERMGAGPQSDAKKTPLKPNAFPLLQQDQETIFNNQYITHIHNGHKVHRPERKSSQEPPAKSA